MPIPIILFAGAICVAYATGSILVGVGNLASSFVQTIKDAKIHIASGAVARGVSIFAMYPLDTIKTRFQMPIHLRNSLPPITISTLFSGVFGSLAGQIPYGMVTFGSYETYKQKLIERFPNTPKESLYLLAAIMGDLTGSLWVAPSEVIKQSIQSGQYKTVAEAFSSIVSNNGFSGLYRGYGGQIARDVPFRAIQLPTYEIIKNFYMNKYCQVCDNDSSSSSNSSSKGKKKIDQSCKDCCYLRPLNSYEATAIGVVAGTFTAAITTPLDVLKTRLQTGTSTGVINTAMALVQKEGVSGMFSGIGPRCLYIGPSCGIFFLAYERTKQILENKKKY